MTAPPNQAVTRMDEIRLRPVVTVAPDARLDQVARIMRAHNVSALVVGNAGDPIAIVTERDLTQALADGCEPGERVVAIASANPLTVAHHASVIEAVRRARLPHDHHVIAAGLQQLTHAPPDRLVVVEQEHPDRHPYLARCEPSRLPGHSTLAAELSRSGREAQSCSC